MIEGLGEEGDRDLPPRLVGTFDNGLLVGTFHLRNDPEVDRKLLGVFEARNVNDVRNNGDGSHHADPGHTGQDINLVNERGADYFNPLFELVESGFVLFQGIQEEIDLEGEDRVRGDSPD
jgi:hypothetical protein